MKGVAILVLCALAGCATGPTLEELEAEALLTGDWSLVEKREQQIERRRNGSGHHCRIGFVAVCEVFVDTERCSCVSSRSIDVFVTTYR